MEAKMWEEEITVVLQRYLKDHVKSKKVTNKFHEAKHGRYILGRKVEYSDKELLTLVKGDL